MVPTIEELARLWLLTQGPFTDARHEQLKAFRLAFEQYADSHPHLTEAFPDEKFKRQELMLRVRAFAHRSLQAQTDEDAPEG